MKAGVKIGSSEIGLNNDVARVSYVPKNEKGYEEHIFAFRGSSVPSALDEPELYAKCKVESQEERQTVLICPRAHTDVVLLTKWEDDKFRRENASMVRRLESFKMQETIRNGQR